MTRLFVILLFTFTSCPSANPQPVAPKEAPRNQWLSAQHIIADVDLLEQSFTRLHPGYARYTPAKALSRYWQSLRSKAMSQNGMRVGDFYQHIQAGLTRIRCDHTKAELPKIMKQARQTLPAYLPARWVVIEGRAFIDVAEPHSGLQHGDEIIAIDGTPWKTLRGHYLPLVSVDGYTDHVRDVQLAASGEMMGGYLEHMLAVAEQVAPVFSLKLLRNDKPIRLEVDKLTFPQWRAFMAKIAPFRRNFVDEVSWQPLSERGALLTVNTFVNYRKPVDPDSLYGEIFAAINAQGRDKLILDLRQNGGGSNDAAVRLLAHLVSKPEPLAREARVSSWQFDDLKVYFSTWDQQALNPVAEQFEALGNGEWRVRDSVGIQPKPAAQVFDGEVIVLTSHHNSSGSTNLISKLKDMQRVTLVGEATGGNSEGPTANILFFVTLPHSGVVARLPTQRVVNNVSQFTPGMGVVPDESVTVTVADWQAGTDRALLTARQMLGI